MLKYSENIVIVLLISFIFTMFHRWFRFCPIVSTIGLFLYLYRIYI